MRKRTVKATALVALASGTLFQFGCLGDFFSLALANVPGTLLMEFLTDNDAIFDLFEDGAPPA